MGVMMVAGIERRPVKGLGHERLTETMLRPGRALEGDRIYALATAQGLEAAEAAKGAWTSCRNFTRPTTDPRLAQVRVVYDPESRWLICRHPDLPKLTADLSTADGGAALCDWLEPLVADARGKLTLVAANPVKAGADAHYADNPAPAVSLMSLSSLQALSARAGKPLDPTRFRGGVWLQGGAPWEEESWAPGARLRLGAATLEILEPIERCASPEANPETGERDAPITKLLHELKGNMDFGMLARVVEGGRVAERDLAAVMG